MARKHLIRYYLEQQDVYTKMLETVKRVDEDYKNGLIDEDRYTSLQKSLLPSIDTVKNNYERISYIMFLLNKPKRDAKGDKYDKLNEMWYNKLKGASKEAVLDESMDALADLKRILSEDGGDHGRNG